MWHSHSGRLIHTLEGHTQAVLSLAFSPDSTRLVSVSADKTALLWEPDSGRLLKTLGTKLWFSDVAMSPNGKQVALALGSSIPVFDNDLGEQVKLLIGHTKAVSSVAFASDGWRLVSGSADKTVRLWDFVSGQLLLTLEGHLDEVIDVAFSPDGRRVASGSHDGTVRLWDVPKISAFLPRPSRS